MAISPLALPPFPLPLAWARMNSTDCTNIPGRAAAGVVDPALEGFQHLDEEPHDAARGVELSALAALGQGELLQEVFVDTAEHIGGAGIGPAEPNVAHEVDDLPQAGLIQRRARVVLGQDVLEGRVVALDGGHGVVHGPPYSWLTRLRLEPWPSRLGRHPEDALGTVLVGVFGVGAVDDLLLQLRVGLLEGIGDVLEEDQAEDDVLVLGGVHAAPEGVGHLPQLGPVVRDGTVAARSRVRVGAFPSPSCRRHLDYPLFFSAVKGYGLRQV